MAKGKRKLKKQIRKMFEELLLSNAQSATDEAAVEKMLDRQNRLFAMFADYTDRLSCIDKFDVKGYMKNFHESLSKDVDAIINEICGEQKASK